MLHGLARGRLLLHTYVKQRPGRVQEVNQSLFWLSSGLSDSEVLQLHRGYA